MKENNLIRPVMYTPGVIYEEWRPITTEMIPNVRPYYYVSNFGRVYSTNKKDFICSQLDHNGYPVINITLENSGHRMIKIHRLVALAFLPIYNSDNYHVNHIDGNKLNSDCLNLEWCSPKYNIQHAYQSGLHGKVFGEDHHNCIITNNQAEQIAQLWISEKYTKQEIADKVGTTRCVVDHITCGTTHTHLYEKYNMGNRNQSIVFSNDQLHQLCKYFEQHRNEPTDVKLYRAALSIIGIDSMDQAMYRNIRRLRKKERYLSISEKYNF